MCLFLSAQSFSEESAPTFSLTYNPMHTALFYAGSKVISAFDTKVMFLPFHLDAHVKIKDWVSLSLGLIYRYKNMKNEGVVYDDQGRLNQLRLWTDYHDLFISAGPRFTPFGTGVEGLYGTLRAGFGVALSPDYRNVAFMLQPEIGYTFMFGNPGFTLNLGAGVFYHQPMWENHALNVSRNWLMLVAHKVTPIINIGLGFNM